MTKNEDANNGSINFGEIGTIRNILMGDQMTQYEQKFRELEETVHLLRQELEEQLQSQSDRSDGDLHSLKADFTGQLATLSNTVSLKNDAIEQKIIDENIAQRKMLGQFFIEFGQKMLDS